MMMNLIHVVGADGIHSSAPRKSTMASCSSTVSIIPKLPPPPKDTATTPPKTTQRNRKTIKKPTTTSSSSNQIKKIKKNLRFAKYDEVYEIEHINDMSDDEIDSCYMSPEESKAIRLECRNLVEKLNSDPYGMFLNDQGFEHIPKRSIYRGLEKHCKKVASKTTAIQDEMYDIVFALQEMQFQHPDQDYTELIAKRCSKITKQARIDARISGIHDAEVVATVTTVATTTTGTGTSSSSQVKKSSSKKFKKCKGEA